MPHSDDTPKGLWSELQSSIVRTSIGRIALAVVLAQAVLRFIYTITWNVLIPFVANFFDRQSESVLFQRYRDEPLRWDLIFGSLLQLALALIFVLFVNRLIRQRPAALQEEVELAEEDGGEQQENSKAAGQQ